MKTGDIVLVPFPFAELTDIKLRPAVVVCSTEDKHKDIVFCAISSVVPSKPGSREIVLKPDKVNKLRVSSIIKVDRIVTLKKDSVIVQLGKLSASELNTFKEIFKALVDS